MPNEPSMSVKPIPGAEMAARGESPRAPDVIAPAMNAKPHSRPGQKRPLPFAAHHDGSGEQELARHSPLQPGTADQQVPQQLEEQRQTQEACCLVDDDDRTRNEDGGQPADDGDGSMDNDTGPGSGPNVAATPDSPPSSPRRAPSTQSALVDTRSGQPTSSDQQPRSVQAGPADCAHDGETTPKCIPGGCATVTASLGEEGAVCGNADADVAQPRGGGDSGPVGGTPPCQTHKRKAINKASGAGNGSGSGSGEDLNTSDPDNRQASGGTGSGSGEGEGSNMPPTTVKHGSNKRQKRDQRSRSQSLMSQPESGPQQQYQARVHRAHLADTGTTHPKSFDQPPPPPKVSGLQPLPSPKTHPRPTKSATFQSPGKGNSGLQDSPDARDEDDAGPRQGGSDRGFFPPPPRVKRKADHATGEQAKADGQAATAAMTAALQFLPWLPQPPQSATATGAGTGGGGSNESSATAHSAQLHKSRASLLEAHKYYSEAQTRFMGQVDQIMRYVQDRPQLAEKQGVDVDAVARACSTANAIISIFAAPQPAPGVVPAAGFISQPLPAVPAAAAGRKKAVSKANTCTPAAAPPPASTTTTRRKSLPSVGKPSSGAAFNAPPVPASNQARPSRFPPVSSAMPVGGAGFPLQSTAGFGPLGHPNDSGTLGTSIGAGLGGSNASTAAAVAAATAAALSMRTALLPYAPPSSSSHPPPPPSRTAAAQFSNTFPAALPLNILLHQQHTALAMSSAAFGLAPPAAAALPLPFHSFFGLGPRPPPPQAQFPAYHGMQQGNLGNGMRGVSPLMHPPCPIGLGRNGGGGGGMAPAAARNGGFMPVPGQQCPGAMQQGAGRDVSLPVMPLDLQGFGPMQ